MSEQGRGELINQAFVLLPQGLQGLGETECGNLRSVERQAEADLVPVTGSPKDDAAISDLDLCRAVDCNFTHISPSHERSAVYHATGLELLQVKVTPHKKCCIGEVKQSNSAVSVSRYLAVTASFRICTIGPTSYGQEQKFLSSPHQSSRTPQAIVAVPTGARRARRQTPPRLTTGNLSRSGAHVTLGGAWADCSGGKRGARPTDYAHGYALTERRVEARVTLAVGEKRSLILGGVQ